MSDQRDPAADEDTAACGHTRTHAECDDPMGATLACLAVALDDVRRTLDAISSAYFAVVGRPDIAEAKTGEAR